VSINSTSTVVLKTTEDSKWIAFTLLWQLKNSKAENVKIERKLTRKK